MSSNEAPFDPYKTLQVDPEAEDEVIEAAYRRLARKYHPDVAPGDDAQARMVALNRAWELLRDPVRRSAVDRARAAAANRTPWESSSPGAAGAAGTTTPTSSPSASASPSPSPRPGGSPSGPHRQASTGPPSTPEPRDSARGATGSAGGTAPDWRSAGAPGSTTRAWPGGAAGAGGPAGYGAFGGNTRRGPDPASPGYSPGRSFTGSGYDPDTMRSAEGTGAAGPPPGNPSGSVLRFGRYDGWSLGEIARVDLEYLEWLDRMPIGRTYQGEIDRLLRAAGRRSDPGTGSARRRSPGRS